MKNKTKKPFCKLLSRNLIFITVPYAVMLVTVFLAAFQMRRLEQFTTYQAADYEEAVEGYRLGRINFRIHVSDVRYTGFDYMVGEKIKGQYFYYLNGSNMTLLLLDQNTSRQLLNGTETKLDIKCSVAEDELTANYITAQYADSLGVEFEEMEGYASPYIFNQLAYPETAVCMLQILSGMSIVLFVGMLLYTAAALICPWLNPEARRLRKLGDVRSLTEELDRELAEHILYQQDQYTVTENYLIAAYITRVDVVRLDDIRYLSKHVETKKRFFSGNRVIYKLTASNVDKMYYECDFTDEEVIDDVIYYIRGDEENGSA